jgi:hypothetical protein
MIEREPQSNISVIPLKQQVLIRAEADISALEITALRADDKRGVNFTTFTVAGIGRFVQDLELNDRIVLDNTVRPLSKPVRVNKNEQSVSATVKSFEDEYNNVDKQTRSDIALKGITTSNLDVVSHGNSMKVFMTKTYHIVEYFLVDDVTILAKIK